MVGPSPGGLDIDVEEENEEDLNDLPNEVAGDVEVFQSYADDGVNGEYSDNIVELVLKATKPKRAKKQSKSTVKWKKKHIKPVLHLHLIRINMRKYIYYRKKMTL